MVIYMALFPFCKRGGPANGGNGVLFLSSCHSALDTESSLLTIT